MDNSVIKTQDAVGQIGSKLISETLLLHKDRFISVICYKPYRVALD